MKLLGVAVLSEHAARRRLFWLLQICGWSGVGILSLYPLFQIFDTKTTLVILLLRVSSGILVTIALRWVYRRIAWRDCSWWRLCGMVLMFSLLLGTADSISTHLLSKIITSVTAPWELYSFLLLMGIILRSSVLMIWSLLYFGIKLWFETAEVKLRAAESEPAARTSELKQLRSQVNPHFLFNALNSVLAEKDDPDAVERITRELSEYLRFSLRPSGNCQILGEELDALEHYLRVEKARFEEKLIYQIDASPEARGMRVPVATVQPLLENAMKYGRKTSPLPLRVKLSGKILPESGALQVSVTNTGRWMAPDETESHGIGLSNLRRRLELLCGNEARLSHDETADGWVTVDVVIPAAFLNEDVLQ